MADSLKSLRFARLEERHLSEVLEIENRTNGAPWSERSFRHEIDHQHGIFKVALLEGRVIGYGGIWLVIDEAHVTTLSVASEARRQGIGLRLMEELLANAKDAGMACSTLEVRAGNEPAIALYEKLGYQSVARRKKYYPDNHEDAVVMWLYELQSWAPSR